MGRHWRKPLSKLSLWWNLNLEFSNCWNTNSRRWKEKRHLKNWMPEPRQLLCWSQNRKLFARMLGIREPHWFKVKTMLLYHLIINLRILLREKEFKRLECLSFRGESTAWTWRDQLEISVIKKWKDYHLISNRSLVCPILLKSIEMERRSLSWSVVMAYGRSMEMTTFSLRNTLKKVLRLWIVVNRSKPFSIRILIRVQQIMILTVGTIWLRYWWNLRNDLY